VVSGPTENARVTMRNYVRRLRQVLGSVAGAGIGWHEATLTNPGSAAVSPACRARPPG